MLLAFAAVATAWSSYQANRWNGETTKASGRVNALRIDAARAQGLAEGQTQVDIAMFFQWVNATETDEPELAEFYETRFRPEFRPAFDAWLATDPLTDPDAPPTPFAMDEYQLQARADSEQADAEAEVMAAAVRRNIQRSANYVLAVVLFAVALFFAGMSTKLRGAGTQEGAARRRLPRLHRDRRLDRHLPDQRVRVRRSPVVTSRSPRAEVRRWSRGVLLRPRLGRRGRPAGWTRR